MATIQIKDLNESREMDREAMRRVVGGTTNPAFIHPPSPYRSPLLKPETTDSLFGWTRLSIDT